MPAAVEPDIAGLACQISAAKKTKNGHPTTRRSDRGEAAPLNVFKRRGPAKLRNL